MMMMMMMMMIKVKVSHYRPGDILRSTGIFRLPEFLDSRHTKVIGLSVLSTGRLYPQEISLVFMYFRG
jgi:hypothetical protein